MRFQRLSVRARPPHPRPHRHPWPYPPTPVFHQRPDLTADKADWWPLCPSFQGISELESGVARVLQRASLICTLATVPGNRNKRRRELPLVSPIATPVDQIRTPPKQTAGRRPIAPRRSAPYRIVPYRTKTLSPRRRDRFSTASLPDNQSINTLASGNSHHGEATTVPEPCPSPSRRVSARPQS